MSYYSVGESNLENALGPASGYGSRTVHTTTGGSKKMPPSLKVRKLSSKLKKYQKKAKKAKTLRLKKKYNAKVAKLTKRIRKAKAAVSRRQRKSKKVMKGGYSQYLSNVPLGAEMSRPGSSVAPGDSYLANPVPFVRTFENSVDNYNHFSGKGSASPTLDQDVNA